MAISWPYSPSDRHIWQFLGTLADANSKSDWHTSAPKSAQPSTNRRPNQRKPAPKLAQNGAQTRLAASTCQGLTKLPIMAIPVPHQATGSLYAATVVAKMAIARPDPPSDRHVWQFLGTVTGANSKAGAITIPLSRTNLSRSLSKSGTLLRRKI